MAEREGRDDISNDDSVVASDDITFHEHEDMGEDRALEIEQRLALKELVASLRRGPSLGDMLEKAAGDGEKGVY